MNETETPNFQEKFYWYALSFSWAGNTHRGAENQMGCVYKGFKTNIVTVPRITKAKDDANMPTDSVLIGLSYMGYATKKEILEED